jgi:hypothetical protein
MDWVCSTQEKKCLYNIGKPYYSLEHSSVLTAKLMQLKPKIDCNIQIIRIVTSVRSEVLTAANISMPVICVSTPFGLVGRY